MGRCRRHNEILMEKRLRFRSDFSDELDIYDCGKTFPEWIYRFREPLLDKVSNPVKQLARLLKDAGVIFKIKWPLESEGQWKFADIYIPATDTVVTITSKSDWLAPTLFMDEKPEFFERDHKVCRLDYDVFDTGHDALIELLEAQTV